MSFKMIAIAIICLAISFCFAMTTIYVNYSPNGTGSGTITDPYHNLQYAIDQAHGIADDVTIYIKGNSDGYYGTISITGFSHNLTLCKKPNTTATVYIRLNSEDNSNSVIEIANNTADITLKNLSITRISTPPTWPQPAGGGIFAYNTGSLTLDNVALYNCRSCLGGGMYIQNTPTTITNSKLYNNSGIQFSGILECQGGSIYCKYSVLNINNSLFYNNASSSSNLSLFESIFLMNSDLIVEKSTLADYNIGSWSPINGDSFTHTYKNSIISKPSISSNPTYTYCYGINTDMTSLPGQGNTIGDPMFVDQANNDYRLTWNHDEKSPCIMSGYDPFTPNDIGVSTYDKADIGMQYNDSPHAWTYYGFPTINQRNGIKWISFPTIDRLYHGEENVMAFNLFIPLACPDILDYIKYKPSGDVERQLAFLNQSGWIGENHPVQPIMGYKIKMRPGLQEPMGFISKGTKPIVATTSIPLYARLPCKNTAPDNENWIGYFVDKTQSVYDAFGGDQPNSALSNIYFIQTQDWTMIRDHDGNWITAAPVNGGHPYTLSYGDMLVVKCYSDMVGDGANGAFHWYTNGATREKYEKEEATRFQYEEIAEYIPVFIDIEGTDLPKEIGLFIDGICMGAAKVIDKLVEVPAYLLEGIPDNKDIEFRLYYDDKANDTIPVYSTMNCETGNYENVPINFRVKQDYYRVKIKTDNHEVITIPQVKISNYPNPFIPSTNIEYYLPKDSNISIDIFNVKGQKVNTLISGFQLTGVHTLRWDGKDDQGKALSNGVYFASMNYNGKQITRKMIMMK